MFYITVSEDNPLLTTSTGVKCNRYELGGYINPEDNDFHKERSILLFDKTIPLKDIDSIFFRNQNKKVYYFRGGENQDKDTVIRVVIEDNQKARVTYFKMINPNEDFPDPKKIVKNKIVPNEEVEKDNPFKNEWGLRDQTVSGDLDGDFLMIQSGLAIQHKNYIPKQINLLNVMGRYRLGSTGLEMSGDLEVSSKKQVARLKIGSGNDTITEIEIKPDDATAFVSYSYKF